MAKFNVTSAYTINLSVLCADNYVFFLPTVNGGCYRCGTKGHFAKDRVASKYLICTSNIIISGNYNVIGYQMFVSNKCLQNVHACIVNTITDCQECLSEPEIISKFVHKIFPTEIKFDRKISNLIRNFFTLVRPLH